MMLFIFVPLVIWVVLNSDCENGCVNPTQPTTPIPFVQQPFVQPFVDPFINHIINPIIEPFIYLVATPVGSENSIIESFINLIEEPVVEEPVIDDIILYQNPRFFMFKQNNSSVKQENISLNINIKFNEFSLCNTFIKTHIIYNAYNLQIN